MNLRAILTIAHKDLLDALRSARLLVIVLLPIGFSVLYGYLFRNTTTSTQVVLYSPEPTALVARLEETQAVSLFVVDSPQAVQATLEKKSAVLGVILPEGFDRDLKAGLVPTVEFIHQQNDRQTLGADRLLLQLMEAMSGRPPVVLVRERSLEPAGGGTGGEASSLSLLAGLSLQAFFVVLWVMMGVAMDGAMLVPTLLVEEKEKKTLDAVLVAPAGYPDVLSGKLVVGLVYSLLSAGVVMVLNNGLVGDVGVTVATVLLASLCLTLVGLLIGGLDDNTSALNTWGTFIMLPLMLPGLLAAVPLGSAGAVVDAVLHVFPTYHLVQGMALAMQGRGGEAWGSLGALVFQAAVLFALVLWSLRRREA
jgi:ABC-2 type transport system permease protein